MTTVPHPGARPTSPRPRRDRRARDIYFARRFFWIYAPVLFIGGWLLALSWRPVSPDPWLSIVGACLVVVGLAVASVDVYRDRL